MTSNDVIVTSMRRHYVASTSVQRRYGVMYLLGKRHNFVKNVGVVMILFLCIPSDDTLSRVANFLTGFPLMERTQFRY